MLSNITSLTLGYLACLHITTMMTMVNFLLVFSFLFVLPFTSYWYLPMLYLPWYLYDRHTPFRGGRRSNLWRNFFLWKYLANYFPIKLYKTADLDSSRNYIFAFHPHGIFVFGGFVNFCTNATGFDDYFPGVKVHMIVLNGQFKFPLYRDYLISAGFGSADRESIDFKLTKNGPGDSVWLAVGGAAEVLLFEHRYYKIRLLDRKGFIKRALFTGACVVPVFSFGEHRLYESKIPAEGSIMWYLQKVVKFITKLDLPDVHGHPWCWYLIPRRLPVNTVVGAPIDFCSLTGHKKGQEAPEKVVDECHKMYMEALRKLYDDQKANFGDAGTPLVFV